jgi:CheY-like chemotaxis protein
MSESGDTLVATSVLIVDDNRSYREAFRRNLELEGFDVVEAEDSEEAMLRLRENAPDVIVTDLSMRHATEGLDLIRQARTLNPHLPIIMISAVGTFEEGAEASRLGARYVISKSKIDEEMENLFKAINQAHAEYRRNLKIVERIAHWRLAGEEDRSAAETELRRILQMPDVGETVKGEAYDALMAFDTPEMAQASRQELDRARTESPAAGNLFQAADASLREGLGAFDSLEHDTQEALRTAEYLYLHNEQTDASVDFSRSIGFSYCFAVENEVKARLRKRLLKFLGDNSTQKLVKSLLEGNQRTLLLFFHQHLLRVLRDINMDVTIDNVFQTFQRIMEHGPKYKPDGLKALGIMLLCFGRSYSFRKFQQEVAVDNPMGIKGLDDEREVLRFATLLTNLQHYRNPYIHPEISEMEKLSKIRETALECLNIAFKLV